MWRENSSKVDFLWCLLWHYYALIIGHNQLYLWLDHFFIRSGQSNRIQEICINTKKKSVFLFLLLNFAGGFSVVPDLGLLTLPPLVLIKWTIQTKRYPRINGKPFFLGCIYNIRSFITMESPPICNPLLYMTKYFKPNMGFQKKFTEWDVKCQINSF